MNSSDLDFGCVVLDLTNFKSQNLMNYWNQLRYIIGWVDIL